MRRVALTMFAKRHFDPNGSGTIITSQSPEQFEVEAESKLRWRGERLARLLGRVTVRYLPMSSLRRAKQDDDIGKDPFFIR